MSDLAHHETTWHTMTDAAATAQARAISSTSPATKQDWSNQFDPTFVATIKRYVRRATSRDPRAISDDTDPKRDRSCRRQGPDPDVLMQGFDENIDKDPFGESTGYYSNRPTNNVITAEPQLQRTDPLLLDIVDGWPPDHPTLSGMPREAELVKAWPQRFPTITAIRPSYGTAFRHHAALRPQMPDEARHAVLELLGWSPYLNLVVAVNNDIDVNNEVEVWWATATGSWPSRDALSADAPRGMPLDASSTTHGTTRASEFRGHTGDPDPSATTGAKEFLEARHP